MTDSSLPLDTDVKMSYLHHVCISLGSISGLQITHFIGYINLSHLLYLIIPLAILDHPTGCTWSFCCYTLSFNCYNWSSQCYTSSYHLLYQIGKLAGKCLSGCIQCWTKNQCVFWSMGFTRELFTPRLFYIEDSL